jgi:AcrR family transcriptional regulator
MQLLLAAAGLFARQGLEATKMGQVAKTAGVSAGLAYHYFPSKEELYHQVLCLALDSAAGTYAQVFAIPGPAMAALEAMLNHIIPATYDAQGIPMFLLVNQALAMESVPAATKDRIWKVTGAMLNQLRQVIERGHADGSIRSGDARGQTGILSAILQGLAILASTPDGLEHFPDAESVISLFRPIQRQEVNP